MPGVLALHTWTLDSTPLAEVLRIARRTGWDAVELRRVDFARAAEKGQSAGDVLDLVRKSGLAVACVGLEGGWIFAEGAERQRKFEACEESCRWANELDCPLVMSPADRGPGDPDRAARSVREMGEIVAKHGLKLAMEFNSQAEFLKSLDRMRDVLARAKHPNCGLLMDSYHLQRSGNHPRVLADLAPGEITYVQYSDVPKDGLKPGAITDRLPPGKGIVPFAEFFRMVQDRGYRGYLSYEAPNPSAWARNPEEVLREALLATRALLPPSSQ